MANDVYPLIQRGQYFLCKEVLNEGVEAFLASEFITGEGIFSAKVTKCEHLVKRDDEYKCKAIYSDSEDFDNLLNCPWNLSVSPKEKNPNQQTEQKQNQEFP